MRVLEALRILQEATVYCKKRNIDTPEVREALDLLNRYCIHKWRIAGFRHNLRSDGQRNEELEGQQQVLRVYFSGIYGDIRGLLLMQIGRLAFRYRKTNDAAAKAELNRLNAELEKLPKVWNFFVR